MWTVVSAMIPVVFGAVMLGKRRRADMVSGASLLGIVSLRGLGAGALFLVQPLFFGAIRYSQFIRNF